MPKSAQDVVKALKLKAQPKNEALSVRLGVKKYPLPFEVRMMNSEGYVFVHIPPAAGIMKITPDGLVPVDAHDEAVKAQVSFRQARKRSSRKSSAAPELSPEIQAALSKIPSGHKLAYDAKGQIRLVKMRKRGK